MEKIYELESEQVRLFGLSDLKCNRMIQPAVKSCLAVIKLNTLIGVIFGYVRLCCSNPKNSF